MEGLCSLDAMFESLEPDVESVNKQASKRLKKLEEELTRGEAKEGALEQEFIGAAQVGASAAANRGAGGWNPWQGKLRRAQSPECNTSILKPKRA